MSFENKCVVLVSSSDGYEDTWYPFFKILKAEWAECPYPIVLNTQSKSFEFEDMNIRTLQLFKANQKVCWGKRLIDTLELIDSEYIIFLMDDYFLSGKVDQERIDESMAWMDENRRIAVFSFYPLPKPNIHDGKYANFVKRPQKCEYKLNCQAALWRKEYLVRYIRPHEDPWQWELYGSVRGSNYYEDFYSLSEEAPKVFLYDYLKYGLRRGRWTESTVQLMEKHKIAIDYSKRGFVIKQQQVLSENKTLNIHPLWRKFRSMIFLIKNKQILEYAKNQIARIRSIMFVRS